MITQRPFNASNSKFAYAQAFSRTSARRAGAGSTSDRRSPLAIWRRRSR